jgi:SSS family solute:Na+ symporter
LIHASYAATLGLVLVGIAIGLNADSIRGVFDWIMGALGAAFIVPNVLRWYWWRLNGWGYAIGTLTGLAMALIVPFEPAWRPMYVSFPLVSIVSLVATLVATWATRPTDNRILTSFYENVRPFGVWGPVRRQASEISDASRRRCENPILAVVNVLLGMFAIGAGYLLPMYLVGHWHLEAAVCLAVAITATIMLYFTWYRHLPPAEEEGP